MDRIVHSVVSLSRNRGGLPVAVAELCSHLNRSGRRIEILATRSPREEWIAMDESLPVISVQCGINSPAASPAFARQLALEHRRNPISLLHLNGIWRTYARGIVSFAESAGIPMIWTPHGMLEPWSLRYHRWRKKAAWLLYQRRALYRAAVLHATAQSEAEQFRNLGFTQPIAVLPNGVAPAPTSALEPEAAAAPRDGRTALFLSRVHPKKGIPMLLEAWARLKPAGWKLIVAGNDDGGYTDILRAQAGRLGLNDSVHFPGPVFGDAKDTLYRRADLFVLPTFSENFGIVIAEALQYGVPVLTTTGAPWKDLQTHDCGWWVEPAPGAIEAALAEAFARSGEQLGTMGTNGAALIEQKYRWPRIAESMLAVYDWINGKGDRPEFVMSD